MMMQNNVNAPDIYNIVKDARTIGISAHIKPDGDAIGSCLGMCLYLKKRLPDADIRVFLEQPGDSFASIPGFDLICNSFDEDFVFDEFIMIDTMSNRLGFAERLFDEAKHRINIDHHVSNIYNQGHVNYIVPEAAASAQLVYDCIDSDYIDSDIASLLYMGIAHDTGVFRYSNTSPETMAIAGKLIGYGFDFSALINDTFYEKSYAQIKAHGLLAYNSRLYFDGQLIVTAADQQFMKENGIGKNDFEGVVSQLILARGTKASVLMYEKEPGLYKVSFRSNTDDVNVSKVAVEFGGGGHVRASGADMRGTESEILERILPVIGEQLN